MYQFSILYHDNTFSEISTGILVVSTTFQMPIILSCVCTSRLVGVWLQVWAPAGGCSSKCRSRPTEADDERRGLQALVEIVAGPVRRYLPALAGYSGRGVGWSLRLGGLVQLEMLQR